MMLAKKNLLKLAVSTALLATTACSTAETVAAAAPAPVANHGYDYSSGSCDPVARRVGGCHRGASLTATGNQSAQLNHADAVWGECLSMVKHAPYWMGMGPDVTGTTVANKATYKTTTVKRKPRAATAAETAAYYKKKGWSTTPVVIKRIEETRQGETVVINTKIEGSATHSGGPSKPAIVPAPSSNVYSNGHSQHGHSQHSNQHRSQQHTYSQPTYGGAQPNVMNPRSARRDTSYNTTTQRTSAPAMAPKTTRIQPPTSKPAMIKPPSRTTIQPPAVKAAIQPPAIVAPKVSAPVITAPAVTAPTVKQVGDTAVKIAPAAPKIRKPLKLKLKAR